MLVTITVRIKAEVPDGTVLSRLYMNLDKDTMSIVSEEGYTPESTVNGYETVSVDEDEDESE